MIEGAWAMRLGNVSASETEDPSSNPARMQVFLGKHGDAVL
jgi:hypothetical protein